MTTSEMRAALAAEQALIQKVIAAVRAFPLGHSHWDSTMQYGRGCELCIRQQKAKEDLMHLLTEAPAKAVAALATPSVASPQADTMTVPRKVLLKAASERDWWHREWHRATGIPCAMDDYCPLTRREGPAASDGSPCKTCLGSGSVGQADEGTLAACPDCAAPVGEPGRTPRCDSFDTKVHTTDYCTLSKGHRGPHWGKIWNWPAAPAAPPAQGAPTPAVAETEAMTPEQIAERVMYETGSYNLGWEADEKAQFKRVALWTVYACRALAAQGAPGTREAEVEEEPFVGKQTVGDVICFLKGAGYTVIRPSEALAQPGAPTPRKNGKLGGRPPRERHPQQESK
jgi:hypothetical protein